MAMNMETKNVTGGKTFLATAHFKARAYTLKTDSVTAGSDGKKIVKAGTPLPANDATAKGLLLQDTDVTNGDKNVSLVFEGEVSTSKLTGLGVTVADKAKTALSRITFFD